MSHTFSARGSSFLLDGEPFQIRSGAIHYFRVHPADWAHSLHNLKALGFNAVETYVPWNLHEPHEGTFRFDGLCDVEAFLDAAAREGLYAIVRPSPFICAEWEWGGLPAWLMYGHGRPRSRDPRFLGAVAAYYDELIPRLAPHQLDRGGNVLMFQVENEYGSYAQDKGYLRTISTLMSERGLTMPFFTSDGPWEACLSAGSLIDDGVLATGNFGSRPEENFAALRRFQEGHGRTQPLMCREFWDGWFSRWGEAPTRRDGGELADCVGRALEIGSVNLYMFHGGTNFGFMNGCSARKQHDLHQITSYDYGAPLDERGNPTGRYDALRAMMAERVPDVPLGTPAYKPTLAPCVLVRDGVAGLLASLDALSERRESLDTQPMELLGQNTGYVLYRTTLPAYADEVRLRVIDASDRVQVFCDGELAAVQYQEEIGDDIFVSPRPDGSTLDVLVENMGRVNYGPKLCAPSQSKGIRQGVMADLHFLQGWEEYPLPLDDISALEFSAEGPHLAAPAFHRFHLAVDEPADTFVDMAGWHKGCVFVNGFNVGRFWEKGPLTTLYVPGGLLRPGVNELVVFETDGPGAGELVLADGPVEIETGA